jgi:DNA mismatch endonuclease (patch repair protein)
MDNHTKEARSYNMSRIKSKDTKPEELVRKFLFKQGFRFRKNVKKLPGCPDIVLPKYRTAIFVNGCFWHMHDACPSFKWPKTNVEYWESKLKATVNRDKNNIYALREMGWKVIVIWECELTKGKSNVRLEKLIDDLNNQDATENSL